VKDFGAKRGVGVEIDPKLVQQCRESAQQAGVGERTEFIEGDLFEADLQEATVITLYLWERMNVQLRPRFFAQLRPGARIVAHDYPIGEWEADQETTAQGPYREHKLFLWIVPAGVAGEWKGTIGPRPCTLRLKQRYQKVSGALVLGRREIPLEEVQLSGSRLRFTARGRLLGEAVVLRFQGSVEGESLRGTVEVEGGPQAGTYELTAQRAPANPVGVWRWEEGALRIERQGNLWKATLLKGEEAIPIHDFYVWGAGLYFTLKEGEATVRYDALLTGNRVVGTIEREGSPATPWEAQREGA